VVAMNTITDPRLDATKSYDYLTARLVCERPCLCRKAAGCSSGQIHCPACNSPLPTLEIEVDGSTLRLHCSADCPDEKVWVAVADLLAVGDPPEVFRYVDAAVGGTDHRNRVRPVDTVQPHGLRLALPLKPSRQSRSSSTVCIGSRATPTRTTNLCRG
jgi:hypothetical protein